MSAHHHSKVEHLLIHLVAVLFLFSSLSAGFLGYGVYQEGIPSQRFLTPRITEAYGYGTTWKQNSWAGGTDGGSTYTLPWGSVGGWDKYSSANNVTIDSNGVKDSGGGTGELISSIFDLGASRRLTSNSPQVDTLGTAILEVRGGNSVSEVQSASWINPGNWPNSVTDKKYVQYKLRQFAWNEYVNSVTFLSATAGIGGSVKDTDTGLPISGATVSISGGQSTTTAFNMLDKNPVVRSAVAAGGGPGNYSFAFEYDASNVTKTLTASKSGYESQSKTVTVDVAYGASADFSLKKVSSSSSSNSSSSGTGTVSGPSVSTETFQSTKLPPIFTKEGSKTTDLSKVTDPKKVMNFTLDIPDKNKIVFKDTLDLSGESTVAALKNLDKYVLMDQPGIIDLDSKTLSALNKKATLTMYKLRHVFKPEILIDGKRDTKNVVGNADYNKKEGTFTFDISHFSVFTAVPKLVLITPTTAIIKSNKVGITLGVSDPNAIVTGSFNGVELAKIIPDNKTGEFTLQKLSFKEGENILKLEATSELGKVLPLEESITYAPNGVTTTEKRPIYQTAAFLYAALSAIAIALVLGYLVYRRRKRHEKIKSAIGQLTVEK